jgi:hypothetical protein
MSFPLMDTLNSAMFRLSLDELGIATDFYELGMATDLYPTHINSFSRCVTKRDRFWIWLRV